MQQRWPENIRTALTVLVLLAAVSVQAAPTVPFEVVFDVYRKGRLSMESRLTVTSDEQGWTVTTRTRGVKGLARFMNLDERSTGRGDWLDGYPRPMSFDSAVKAALVDRGWKADYDWDEGVVRTVHDEGESVIELAPGVVDDASVNFVIQLGLARGEAEWHLRVVDEDEIDHDHYRAHPPERLDTALGCMDAVRVEKVRLPDSSRYTYTWFARDHAWAPVKLVHGKKGDSEIESRLKSLSVAGQPVAAGGPCE